MACGGHARLLEEVRQSREQLRSLSRRLVTMQEAERSYVADQLYNQAGQVLAALQLQLSLLRSEDEHAAAEGRLSTMQTMLDQAIHDLHDLASGLRPAGLDRSTLARVLRSHLVAFGIGLVAVGVGRHQGDGEHGTGFFVVHGSAPGSTG